MVIDMIRKAPAMTVRTQLGELLNEVQYRGDSIMITKSGKPVAALIDIDMFQRLVNLDKNFDAFKDSFSQAFSQLSDHETESLFDEAIQDLRSR